MLITRVEPMSAAFDGGIERGQRAARDQPPARRVAWPTSGGSSGALRPGDVLVLYVYAPDPRSAPAEDGPRRGTGQKDPLTSHMPKSRILVIDDEAAIRDSLRMTLEYEGYEFVGAATGQEGLALVEREAPDLVLLDVKMPGMDGLEVLDRLHAMNETLPVVMISGHGTISTAVEATKKGAFDFIEKPFASERVLVSLRNALDQAGCATRTGRSRRRSKSAIR